MTIQVRFDCEDFQAAANDTGSISIRAKLTSLTDSEGLLLAIARSIGAEHARKILDIELTEAQDSPVINNKPQVTVHDLKKLLLSPDKIIETKIPDGAYSRYRQGLREQHATGIGQHTVLGWFVLKGIDKPTPTLVWSEH